MATSIKVLVFVYVLSLSLPIVQRVDHFMWGSERPVTPEFLQPISEEDILTQK